MDDPTLLDRFAAHSRTPALRQLGRLVSRRSNPKLQWVTQNRMFLSFSVGRWGISFFSGLALLVAGLSPAFATGEEPLHQQIDEIIAAGIVAPPGERADDAEFLRRVYLDLTGTIPSAEEARAFLKNPAPDKRTKLIDELLVKPEHFQYLATTFDFWIMERRAETHVKSPGWKKFLTDSFAANKPYHHLVGEILAADGTDAKNREAARFYLDRLGEPNLITRDVGRLFFGQDLQCAQCHDHPNISDYLQRDYYGMFAFFGRTYLFQPDKKKPAVLAEKAIGGGDFKSVFTDVEATLLPQVLQSELVIPDPLFAPGEEFKVKPDPKDKKVQPIPKYSRRGQVVKAATESNNPAFNRNIANRLWAQMMGRGLVEPLDFHHASNPPSHPELLELLAMSFASMNYDVRAFLRELALTETYQRKFTMPVELTQQAAEVKAKLESLKAEDARRMEISQAAAQTLDQAKMAWNEARKVAVVPEAAFAAADKKRIAAATAMTKANDALKISKEAREKVVAKTVEGKTDPSLAKLEADVAAKQKATDAARKALDVAVSEAEKLKPPVDAEQKKVVIVTAELEVARNQYDEEKTAWKLAQRKLQDAVKLIEYADAVRESEPPIEKAEKLAMELADVKRDADARAKLAADLKTAADSAQEARSQLPDDDDLVLAAAVLGDRSIVAREKSENAAKALAAKSSEFATADSAAKKLRDKKDAALETLTDRWADAFAVGSFTQLTPEQLCLAMLQSTGEVDKYQVAGDADFTKKLAAQEAATAKTPAKPDPKKPIPVVLKEADRNQHVQDYVAAKIDAMTKRFISLFGGQAGLPQTDFFATADQALFFSNDGTLRSWLRPSGENLSGRLLKMEDAEAIAEELYLSILTRQPDPIELDAVKDYLQARGEKKSEAIQELGWALVSSVEFRFKH